MYEVNSMETWFWHCCFIEVMDCISCIGVNKVRLNAQNVGKIAADDVLKYFLFYIENRIWHFMQVSQAGSLDEMSNTIFWEKYKSHVISFVVSWIHCPLLRAFFTMQVHNYQIKKIQYEPLRRKYVFKGTGHAW